MKYSILALFAFGLASLVSGEWVDPGIACNELKAAAEEVECNTKYLAKGTLDAGNLIAAGTGNPGKYCSTAQEAAECVHAAYTKYCGIKKARQHMMGMGGSIGIMGDPNAPECKKYKYYLESGDAASLEMASLKQLVALAAAVAFAARIAFLR